MAPEEDRTHQPDDAARRQPVRWGQQPRHGLQRPALGRRPGQPDPEHLGRTGFPIDITASGTSAYVTPGSGLLYTQVQGKQTTAGGSLFLVTDTGLRYAVQANGDSDSEQSKIGAPDQSKAGTDGRPEASQAQVRLGYGNVAPAMVPIAWSEFLSKGPRLDTNSARQPQGS